VSLDDLLARDDIPEDAREVIRAALESAHESEGKAQAHNGLLPEILESTADGLLVVDADGRVMHTNRRFAEMWRIPQSLLNTRDDEKLLEYVLSQLTDPNAFLAKVQKLYSSSDEDWDTLLFRDGRIFDRHSCPLTEDGAIVGRVWSFRDVTRQRRTEEALNERLDEDQYFRQHLRELHEITLELSSARTVEELCRCAVALGQQRLGFDRLGIWFPSEDPGFVIGSYGIDESGNVRDERGNRVPVKPGGTMAYVLEDRMRVGIETNDDLFDGDHEVVGRGTRISAGMWDGEKPIGCLCTDNLLSGRQLTDRQSHILVLYAAVLGHQCARIRGQEALEKSEERLELALKGADLGLWDWDVRTGQVTYNERWAQIIGYSLDEIELTYETWETRIHPEDREQTLTALADHYEERISSLDVEHRLRTKSGDYTWVLGRGTVTQRDEAGRPLRATGTMLDISERKRVEQERRSLDAELQHHQKLESLSILAGGVAHDFNNLLMGVLGHAELARARLTADSPLGGHLEEIETAATRAADLARQMLAYSGRGTFVLGPVNLSRLVEENLHLLQASASKKAELILELGEHLPAAEGDATQLSQVIMNLVLNASEALGDEPGRITVATGVMDAGEAYLEGTYLVDYELPQGDYAYLRVSDTGCGMDEETKARVFEPFFSTKFIGRGLGLAATLGIVRGHRGAIRVDSEPDRGSTLTILLPCGQTTPEPGPLEAETAVGEPWRGSGLILVADDEHGVRSVAELTLEMAGFSVLMAQDGQQAIDLFAAHRDELVAVLLDLTMPRKSGEQVFEEIHALRPDVPIVLSSGFAEEEVTGHFVDDAPAGFIQKPYRPVELIDKLRAVLGG